jgi:hypothetical protein
MNITGEKSLFNMRISLLSGFLKDAVYKNTTNCPEDFDIHLLCFMCTEITSSTDIMQNGIGLPNSWAIWINSKCFYLWFTQWDSVQMHYRFLVKAFTNPEKFCGWYFCMSSLFSSQSIFYAFKLCGPVGPVKTAKLKRFPSVSECQRN